MVHICKEQHATELCRIIGVLCISGLGCVCTSIRGSWDLSPCYIPCRLAWSEAFICICSCRPSVTTTACESRPVNERQQLKGKVVFVHSCQIQSKTHFCPTLSLKPPPLFSPLFLISQECLLISLAAPHHIFHVLYSIEYLYWHLFYPRPTVKT